MSLELRPLEPDDAERVAFLVGQAFNRPTRGMRDYVTALKDVQVVVDRGQVVGTVRAVKVGQYFGGRSVPTVDIRFVVVSAEARGRGVFKFMFEPVLREFRSEGVAMSTLSPSSVSAYRRIGYEIAGMWQRWKAPVEKAPSWSPHQLEQWGPEQLPEIVECYRRYAERASGLIDRDDAWWQELVLSPSQSNPQYRYLVRRDGAVTGYVIYTQRTIAVGEFKYALDVRDLVWLEEADARALLAFLNGSRALATDAEWSGPVDEPLTSFFPEEVVTPLSSHSWMCRTLDPSAAVTTRGYPSSLNAALDVQIVDPFLGTTDSLRIRIAKGEATVEPAPSASLRMSAGTFASLLTGWRLARDAQRTGQIEGATATDVETLEAAFAGPKPWVMDLV